MSLTIFSLSLLLTFVRSSGNRELKEYEMDLCNNAKPVFTDHFTNFQEGPDDFGFLEHGVATDVYDDFNYDEANDLNVIQYKYAHFKNENSAVKNSSKYPHPSRSRARAFTKEWLNTVP